MNESCASADAEAMKGVTTMHSNAPSNAATRTFLELLELLEKLTKRSDMDC